MYLENFEYEMSSDESDALVNLIYQNSGSSKSGLIDRIVLK